RARHERQHLSMRHLPAHRGGDRARGRRQRIGRFTMSAIDRDPLAPSSASPPIEPERYELFEGPAYRFELLRREFLQLLGVVLVLGSWAAAEDRPRQGRGRPGEGGGQLPQDIGAWLHVGEDGAITVYTGKAEMGQNIRTSLTQVVAEEMHVPVASIKLVMGD